MRHLLAAATVVLGLMIEGRAGPAQASAASQVTADQVTASGQKAASGGSPEADDSKAKRTDKQLALQAQTDRLVTMATELRDQVDKTNKNILSIKVVRKAEEIEQFAKLLKEQNRK